MTKEVEIRQRFIKPKKFQLEGKVTADQTPQSSQVNTVENAVLIRAWLQIVIFDSR